MSFRDEIGRKLLFFDGGMGVLMMSRGLPPGKPPVDWNIERPGQVVQIHKEYLDAGADVITANTFSIFNASDKPAVIQAAMKNARQAVAGTQNRYIAFDIGPTGRLLSPMGGLTFEGCYAGYKEIAAQAASLGADLFVIETMADLLELKAALLAASETGLPVVCEMTFEQNGHTLMGADPCCFTAMAQAMGACAVGLNCGIGPGSALGLLPEFFKCAKVPVIVQPNAGLPETIDGQAVYKLTPSEFAASAREMAVAGVALIGGCCGTGPNHIKEAVLACAGLAFEPPGFAAQPGEWVSSARRAILFEPGKAKIGDITAKNAGDMDEIADEAFDLAGGGCDIVNINIDEATPESVAYLQGASLKEPISIQASNPAGAEAALRGYRGRPLLNVSGLGPAALSQMGRIAAKYGALIYEHNNRG